MKKGVNAVLKASPLAMFTNPQIKYRKAMNKVL